MKNYLKSNFNIYVLLLLILILGGIFRFNGLNWDQGYHLHPDERMITMVTERIHLPKTLSANTIVTPHSPLNPKFFPYGSFPIYLLKVTGFLASFVNENLISYAYINLIGRGISAVSDLALIVVIFLLGKKVWSENVGLIAAVFYSLSVFPVQASHFYAVDTLLSLFIMLTLYRLVIFYEKPKLKNAVYSGIFFGLSLATKVSASVLIAAVGAALLVDLFLLFLKRVRQIRIVPKIHREFFDFINWTLSAFKGPKRRKLLKLILFVGRHGIIILGIAVITFVIFEPYAVIDFETFLRQTLEQRNMTKSAYTFPYTLQYVGTVPYVYHLKNFVLWGVGIPLGILAIVSTIWIARRLVIEVPKPGKENQEAKILILYSFFLVYFLIVGRFAVKFMRYLLPVYGLFALFSGWFVNNLISKSTKKSSLIGMLSLILVSLFSFIWVLAFSSIYTSPNTRVQATDWFKKNVVSGSLIAAEHWDDRVPMGGDYEFLEMPMYEADESELKWRQVGENLAKADYLVLASNRLYTPLQRLSDCSRYQKRCFPKTAKYYTDLFSGKLGFEKVAEFTSFPRIRIGNFVYEIDDSSADESFTVYDHPKVIILKKQSLNNEEN